MGYNIQEPKNNQKKRKKEEEEEYQSKGKKPFLEHNHDEWFNSVSKTVLKKILMEETKKIQSSSSSKIDCVLNKKTLSPTKIHKK